MRQFIVIEGSDNTKLGGGTMIGPFETRTEAIKFAAQHVATGDEDGSFSGNYRAVVKELTTPTRYKGE